MIVVALHNLKSPVNVGIVVRSQLAFGGSRLIFVGQKLPWRFKKSTQAFSRKLEKQLDVIHLPTDDMFFDWCDTNSMAAIALEISSEATSLDHFTFPADAVLACGNEATGLPRSFCHRCSDTVVVPQSGPVGSLNVATACSIALYKYSTQHLTTHAIADGKFVGEQQVV